MADQDDSKKVRLTQSNVQRLLEDNDGFEASTNYSGKNFQETRQYRVSDGELRVRATGKTSWADSRFEDEFVADADQTRRFLRNNLEALNTEGVTGSGDRASHSVVDQGEKVDRPSSEGYVTFDDEDYATFDDEDYATFDDEDDRALLWVGVAVLAVVGAVIAAPHVRSLWRSKVKPAGTNLRNKLTKQGHTDVHPESGSTDDDSA